MKTRTHAIANHNPPPTIKAVHETPTHFTMNIKQWKNKERKKKTHQS